MDDPLLISKETIQSVPGQILVIPGKLMVEWVELGEGIDGDYHADDPDDVELLRFDINVWDAKLNAWVDPGDVSYCTRFPVKASPELRQKGLQYLADNLLPLVEIDFPIKKQCERLSWIYPEWLEKEVPNGGALEGLDR
jgi:hypothetical protein